MPSASLDTVHAVRQVWFARPALASAGGQPDWPVPARRRSTRSCRRRGAAASAVATAMDRNTVATSWMRAGRGAGGRLGGKRVDLGWLGPTAAAPFLGPDPAVTDPGAGRHGPAGPGGGRGPGPAGRQAAADRHGQATGASGGRRPRPPASYRRRPCTRPSPPGVTVVLTLDPARGHRRHPDRVIPAGDLRRRLVGCERSCARH
jgi:hypothetical protein